MITDDELRDLIALGDKATARPWNCDTQLGNVEPYTDEHEIGVYDGVDHEDYGYDANGIRHQASIGFCYSDSDGEDALNNAAYITAAANLAPAIARELIEARAELAKANEDADALDDEILTLMRYVEPGEDYYRMIKKHVAHRARIGGDK